ncbi:MAG: OmpA family protein [Bacteroidia bacterium]|nr:OmpA family protein [Bacteroidia bacterium]
MKLTKFIVFLLLGLGFGANVFAQEPIYTNADDAYMDGKYKDAIRLYEKSLEKKPNPGNMRKLADCYHILRNFPKALEWFEKLCDTDSANTRDHLMLAKMLKTASRYDEAELQADRYLKSGGNAETAGLIKRSCEFSREALAGETGFTITPTDFNSEESDFAPVLYGKGLVFTSNREHGSLVTWTDEKTGALFHDLYYVDLSKSPSEVAPLDGPINSNLNDAAATFTLDENITYFTRNRTISRKELRKDKAVGTLNIFESTYDGKKWKGTRKLKFNADEYSTGHPTISEDGQMLFFVSDAPGGQGGADIYVSYKKGDTWGKPENLGPEINTPEDEMFPMFYKNNVLFFATEGHEGLGGLDVFYVTYIDGKWGAVKNPGYPLNSPYDDFGITVTTLGSTGYISSNRPGGKGQDDIYYFKSRPKILGTVADATTNEPLEEVKVVIEDGTGTSQTLSSDAKGEFSTFTQQKITLMVRTSKDDYEEGKHIIKAQDVGALWEIRVDLKLIPKSLFTVEGFVTDSITGNILEGVTVSVMEQKDARDDVTKEDGSYKVKLGKVPATYYVSYQKDGYVPVIRSFDTKGLERKKFIMDVAMVPGRGYIIEASVVDKSTRMPVPGMKIIEMTAAEDSMLQRITTDEGGRCLMVGNPELQTYLITQTSKKYFSDRQDVPQMGRNSGPKVTVQLEVSPYETGGVVQTVYFDYDRAKVTRKARSLITPLIYFLTDNPETQVELAGHTDSRGSDSYNLKLSQRRADAVKEFIAEKGVDPSRITTVGYGESRLAENCPDGVDCSEDQHYENRRCEMRVIGLDAKVPDMSAADKMGQE